MFFLSGFKPAVAGDSKTKLACVFLSLFLKTVETDLVKKLLCRNNFERICYGELSAKSLVLS